jgi:hypothetical protein
VAALLIVIAPTLSVGSGDSTRPSGNTQLCEQRVKDFLGAPNSASLALLRESPDGDCWPAVGTSNELLQSLLKSVAGGSKSAAEYLASHLQQLDGGNLEDSLIALGQFSETHMDAFFGLAASGALSDNQLRRALTMLPLELSDEPNAQLSEMKKRRSKVEKVTGAALSRYRKEALAEIDAFIAEIERSISTAASSTTSSQRQE